MATGLGAQGDVASESDSIGHYVQIIGNHTSYTCILLTRSAANLWSFVTVFSRGDTCTQPEQFRISDQRVKSPLGKGWVPVEVNNFCDLEKNFKTPLDDVGAWP
jgi:hypothetical protein